MPFDRTKIFAAVMKAANAVQGTNTALAQELADQVVDATDERLQPGEVPTVEAIQDAIEKVLIETGHARTAKAFILYRARRSRIREGKSELMDAVGDILREMRQENDGANAAHSTNPSTKMYRIGAAASREYYLKRLLPEEMADAHLRGDLHIHDLEVYATSPNSFVAPLDKLLANGFALEFGTIRPPRRPASAAALAALILQSAQNDCYGGQCFAHFDRDLGAALGEWDASSLEQAMEALIFSLNAMYSRSGGQVPYSSLNFGVDTTPAGRAVTRALLVAYRNGLGRGEPPVFPNLVFRVKSGINLQPEDPNHDLLELAIETAALGMNPTFAFLDASANQGRGTETTYYSGASRLSDDRLGGIEASGRGAIASVTINLPRLALKSRRLGHDFDALLEAQVRLAGRQLVHRLATLGRLHAHDLPFLIAQGLYRGSGDLAPGDAIEAVLRHGTLSMGFIGLAEALMVLHGHHHGEGEAFQAHGLALVAQLRAHVKSLCERENLNFALYAPLSMGIGQRFVQLDRRELGLWPGVTDRPHYTSGFSLPEHFSGDVATRIALEAPYHAYCDGGHLTVLTLPEQPTPQEITRHLARMIESNCAHGGFCFPLDHCMVCGKRGTLSPACTCGASEGNIRRIRRLGGYLVPLERSQGHRQQSRHAVVHHE